MIPLDPSVYEVKGPLITLLTKQYKVFGKNSYNEHQRRIAALVRKIPTHPI